MTQQEVVAQSDLVRMSLTLIGKQVLVDHAGMGTPGGGQQGLILPGAAFHTLGGALLPPPPPPEREDTTPEVIDVRGGVVQDEPRVNDDILWCPRCPNVPLFKPGGSTATYRTCPKCGKSYTRKKCKKRKKRR